MKHVRFCWLLLLLPLAYGATLLDGNLFHKRGAGCPFCEAESLHKQLLFSDEAVHILYDYKPVVKGHILVVPRRHVERFEELSNEEVSKVASLIRKVHGALSGAFAFSLSAKIERDEFGRLCSEILPGALPQASFSRGAAEGS